MSFIITNDDLIDAALTLAQDTNVLSHSQNLLDDMRHDIRQDYSLYQPLDSRELWQDLNSPTDRELTGLSSSIASTLDKLAHNSNSVLTDAADSRKDKAYMDPHTLWGLGSNSKQPSVLSLTDTMPTLKQTTRPSGKSIPRRKSSLYRGVSYNFKSNKWKAVITVNKKQCFLGYFDDEEEAARAYDQASMKHRGPYGKLNFSVSNANVLTSASLALSSSCSSPSQNYKSSPSLEEKTNSISQAISTNAKEPIYNKSQPLYRPPALIHMGQQSHFSMSNLDVLGNSKPASAQEDDANKRRASIDRSRPRLDIDMNSTPEDNALESPRKRVKSVEECKVDSPTSAQEVPWAKTSKYRGVSFNRKNCKYKAVLTFKGRQIFLGYFEDEIKAAQAYDAASLKYRGCSATLNFAGDEDKRKTLSKYCGVSWCDQAKRWKAIVTHGTTLKFCGYFDTETEAARAHDLEAIKLSGSQAVTNFPISSFLDADTNGLNLTTKDLIERSERLRLDSPKKSSTTSFFESISKGSV